MHGPRPLPRSAPYTPQLLLSANVKFAPFASRHRRGYVRDASERDLAVHLETALRGIVIRERWPKSGLDVVITVLEGENDYTEEHDADLSGCGRCDQWGLMSILSSCITVASAAIADAGIDCIDIVTGGVAAMVGPAVETAGAGPVLNAKETAETISTVRDLCPSEHRNILAACVVGYSQATDEITELWIKGDVTEGAVPRRREHRKLEALVDQAIEAAITARLVLIEAITCASKSKLEQIKAYRA